MQETIKMLTKTRNKRKNLIGIVSSISGNKTVKVVYSYKIPHPLYKKEIKRKTVVHVHDNNNECKVGDKVGIMEIRPCSKLKRWRVVSILQASPSLDA